MHAKKGAPAWVGSSVGDLSCGCVMEERTGCGSQRNSNSVAPSVPDLFNAVVTCSMYLWSPRQVPERQQTGGHAQGRPLTMMWILPIE
eukprot:56583-Eustigmatos_ZCMA.PRE.3